MYKLIDSIMKKIRENKKVAVAVLIAIPLLIILIAIIVIINQNNSLQNENAISQEGEWTQEQVDDFNNNDQFAFTNRRRFDTVLGSDNSAIVYDNLKDFVLSESEKKTAPHQNSPAGNMPSGYYTGNLTDFEFLHTESIDSLPMQAFKFNLNITDGREYEVHVAFDNLTTAHETSPIAQYYLATFLKHKDNGNVPVLYINGTIDKYDSDIWTWLETIGFNRYNVDIIYKT